MPLVNLQRQDYFQKYCIQFWYSHFISNEILQIEIQLYNNCNKGQHINMKEKTLSFRGISSNPNQNKKIIKQMDGPNPKKMATTFELSLRSFQKCTNNIHAQKLQILDCFNNLSSAIEDEPQQRGQEIMRCKKVFQRGGSQSQLPKFSSIESGETSVNNSMFQDQIVAIDQKSRYECDDQYSFNGDQTERYSLIHKNTQNKTKYEKLIQKIDNFLVKDFNQEIPQILSSSKKEKKLINQSKQSEKACSNSIKNKRQQCQKLTQILQEQSTVRQKLDFLSNYAEHLEEESINLRSQLKNQEQITSKVQILTKQILQKDIVIDFLTKQLGKKNSKPQNNTKRNKENRASKINNQKQRNTVSAVNILLLKDQNKHPPKYRASHQVQSNNDKFTTLKLQINENTQFSEGISGDSFKSKSKGNSFMKKIFRRSDQKQQYKDDRNVLKGLANQNEEAYLIQILKEENSLLSTKLNILYGDFQQIIEKYNQVLTQKNICKQKCCLDLNKKQYPQYMEQQQLNYQQNFKAIQNDILEAEDQMDLFQIKSILGQLNQTQQNFIFEHNSQFGIHQAHKIDEQEGQLFSEDDYEKLRRFSRQKITVEPKILMDSNHNNVQIDRRMLMENVCKKIGDYSDIKKSLILGKHFRLSMQQKHVENEDNQKIFFRLDNKDEHILKKKQSQQLKIEFGFQERQRIAPRESSRQNTRRKINICTIK